MRTRISLFFTALALGCSVPAWSQVRNGELFNGEREWIHEYGYTLGAVLGSYTGTPMAYHLNQGLVYTPRLVFPFKNAGSMDVVPNVGLGLTSSLLLGRSNLIASELGCMVHLNSGLGSTLDNASTFGAYYGIGLQTYTIHIFDFLNGGPMYQPQPYVGPAVDGGIRFFLYGSPVSLSVQYGPSLYIPPSARGIGVSGYITGRLLYGMY
jgi:hypothetical protein